MTKRKNGKRALVRVAEGALAQYRKCQARCEVESPSPEDVEQALIAEQNLLMIRSMARGSADGAEGELAHAKRRTLALKTEVEEALEKRKYLSRPGSRLSDASKAYVMGLAEKYQKLHDDHVEKIPTLEAKAVEFRAECDEVEGLLEIVSAHLPEDIGRSHAGSAHNDIEPK